MQEKGFPEETVGISIGEAARIFNIPASTLRYWQSEGLLTPERNRDNNYRRFVFDDVILIGDLVSFRNLDIPIESIRRMRDMNMEELNTVFLEAQERLRGQVARLTATQRQIQERLNMLAQVQALVEAPYTINKPHVRQLLPRRYYSAETWNKYFAGQYQFGFLVRSRLGIEREYGWVNLMDNLEDGAIWEYIDRGQRYAVCLLRVAVGDRDNNDLPQHLENLRHLGYSTGDVIAEFVVTAQDDTLYDYYKAWIEVE